MSYVIGLPESYSPETWIIQAPAIESPAGKERTHLLIRFFEDGGDTDPHRTDRQAPEKDTVGDWTIQTLEEAQPKGTEKAPALAKSINDLMKERYYEVIKQSYGDFDGFFFDVWADYVNPGGASRALKGSDVPAHTGADANFMNSLKQDIYKLICTAYSKESGVQKEPSVELRVLRPNSGRDWLALELRCQFMVKISIKATVAVRFYLEKTDCARGIALARLSQGELADFEWDSLRGTTRYVISFRSTRDSLLSRDHSTATEGSRTTGSQDITVATSDEIAA